MAQARSLKDACYAAWSSDPARAAEIATQLDALVPTALAEVRTEVAALADWTAGIASTGRGRMAEAVDRFDAAERGLLAAGQPDAAAQTQVPKIMALSMLGRHGEAAACAERAQATLVALGNLAAAGRVSQNLGGMHLRRDAYDEAARHFRLAAVLFARVGDPERSVLADIGTADALAARGDLDEALRLYARARMRAAHRGLTVPVALVDESVALVELARGRFQPALAGLEAARAAYEGLHLLQHQAIAEKQLGDAYLELRLLPEALALFETAVARFGELELPEEQAWALLQQGRALVALGRGGADPVFEQASVRFEAADHAVGRAAIDLARAELRLTHADAVDALALAERAGAGYAAAGQAQGRSRADTLRAEALLQQGAWPAARAAFEQALTRARASQQLAVEVRCLTGLGLVARAAGDEAAAVAAFDAAIARFEEQRDALPGDEIRAAFLTDHLRAYQERLRNVLAEGTADDVLRHLERYRARTLDERLADAAAPPAPADPDVEALRARLAWLYRRAHRQGDVEPSATLIAETVRTEAELLEHARRQRLLQPAGAASAAAWRLDELRAALGPDEALVEYGVLDDELFACIVTRDAVRCIRHVAGWAEVRDAVRAVRFQIDSLRHGSAPLARHLPTLVARAERRLTALHALVWAPLEAAFADCRRVLVVPCDELGAMPFAALDDGTDDGDGALSDRYDIAIVPSAGLALRGLRRPPRPPRRAGVLGESSRLPNAAREARFVAGLFPGTEPQLDEAATLAAFEAVAIDADVIHLACHAVFRADNPRFSALHLHDGALHAERIETMALAPCTVVLSGCETGLGAGDEMVGLVRAFMIAGAARVLASLWPVDDAVAAAFMTRFYAALQAGTDAAGALRIAQQAVRAQHPHPAHWAAFALHGGW